MMSRLDKFNDDEVYMLKRMAIESSWKIVMEDRYSKEDVDLHTRLVNELSDEDSKRIYK